MRIEIMWTYERKEKKVQLQIIASQSKRNSFLPHNFTDFFKWEHDKNSVFSNEFYQFSQRNVPVNAFGTSTDYQLLRIGWWFLSHYVSHQ